MRKFTDSLKARAAAKNEGGFSLIDVVVTVAIIVALSVGGFVAYNGLIESAKSAAVAGAADQVYTASVVALNDGNPDTNPTGSATSVVETYNASTNDIKVSATVVGGEVKVQAWNSDGGKLATYADQTNAKLKTERGAK